MGARAGPAFPAVAGPIIQPDLMLTYVHATDLVNL